MKTNLLVICLFALVTLAANSAFAQDRADSTFMFAAAVNFVF